MRLIYLVLLSILAVSVHVTAQEHSHSIVFRNNQTGEQHKINQGDFVKLRLLEGNEKKRYSGTFKEVNEGILALKGQRNVAMDNIVDIAYRPKAARWLFWGLLFIGIFLGGFAFITVFAEYVLAVTLAKAALVSVALAIAINLGSVQRIQDVNTQWTYEYHFPTTPKQQMMPVS